MKNKKIQIVLLHGWGLSSVQYGDLKSLFEKMGYKVFIPDLPGFGNEKVTYDSMNLSDYCNFLKDYLEKNNIETCVLIGHSFGGRIAVRFTSTHEKNVKLLVLTGVPIIRHFGIKQKTSFVVAKTVKILFKGLPDSFEVYSRKVFYKIIGEQDYIKSGSMKKIFQNIINEPLIDSFKKITVPVVLIWGELDRLTPMEDIVRISRLGNVQAKDILKGYGHSVIYQEPELYAKRLNMYIQKYV